MALKWPVNSIITYKLRYHCIRFSGFRTFSNFTVRLASAKDAQPDDRKKVPNEIKNEKDIADFLSTPTWSVKSLLPDPSQTYDPLDDEITPLRLRHLLRLSALPPPSTAAEEAQMLSDLRKQLHFVRSIQKVDTTNVEPLRAVHDETPEAQQEREIGMEQMKEALEKEEVVGKWHRRIRRKQEAQVEQNETEQWDVLGGARKKVGRFFVVDGEDT